MLRVSEPLKRVDLAAEPAFAIGDMSVTPALRQVERRGDQVTLEPRVMQVLVALGRPPGRVVSRDELAERCWDGRIVGENALQRVISRIRQLALTLGGFELETITKVGYRLLAAPTAAEDISVAAPLPAAAPPVGRRRLLLGALAGVAGVGGGVAAWRALAGDDGNAKLAETLVGKGREALMAGLGEQTEQAVAYFKRATELDPGSAAAWGALAYGYQLLIGTGSEPDPPAQAAWARAAARRALALDGGNVDAKAALAAIRPNFRNWAANEAVLRGLMAAHPGEAVLEGDLGWLLCDTGRWRDAIACFRRALVLEPFHAARQLVLAWGLWGGGELAETERVLAEAAKLWPGHRAIWTTRFEFFATMGQPGAAQALIDDPAARPLIAPGDTPPPYDMLLDFVAAMRTRSPADIARAAAAIDAARLPSNRYATFCCALGRPAPALERLEIVYFGTATQPPPGPYNRMKTSILFSAKAEPLRRLPGYPGLTRRLGLDDYWRVTGTRPDTRV